MKKWLIRLMAVLALITGGVVAVASPAMAASPTCDINSALWVGSGGGWGQFRWCQASGWNGSNYEDIIYFQVDDTLTDGYQVHLEVSDSCCIGETFRDFEFDGASSPHGECQSAGAVTSCYQGPYVSGGGTSGDHVWARIVKGRAYTPAQHIAYGSTWTVGYL